MAEWSKAHAWKVCIPHKGIEGSNPSLSASPLTCFSYNHYQHNLIYHLN
jgi:hypothetical protein